MNTTPTALAAFCAALLSGCSSAPTLPVPNGEWEDFVQQPVASPTTQYARALAADRTSSATAYKPNRPESVTAPAVTSPAVERPPLTVVTPPSKPMSAPTAPVAAPPARETAPKAALAGADSHSSSKPATVAPKVAADAALPLDKTSTRPDTKAVAQTLPATPASKVSVMPIAKPPAPPPKPMWDVQVGESLRKAITRWCQRAHYTLDWRAEDLDYPIEAPLHFTGSFEEAVTGIFKLYDQAPRSFIVDGRIAQSRLIVSENTPSAKRATP